MKNYTVTYESDSKMFYDFFIVVNMLTKYDNLLQAYGDVGEEMLASESQAYNRVRNALLDNEIRTGFNLFCSEGSRNRGFMYMLFRDSLEPLESLEELVDAFEAKPYKELIVKLIAHYDNRDNLPMRFYKQLCADSELLSDYVNGMDINSHQRMELISFMLSPEHIKQNTASLLRVIINAMRAEYRLYEDNVRERETDVIKSIEQDGDKCLVDGLRYYQYLLRNRHVDNVKVTYCVTLPYNSQVVMSNGTLHVFLGRDFDSKGLLIDTKSASVISAKFKPFADDIRVKVLQHLLTENLSLAELSAKLCMPATSLLHHLNIMENAGIITRENTAKKGQYSIRKQGFISAVYTLKLFMDCCEFN